MMETESRCGCFQISDDVEALEGFTGEAGIGEASRFARFPRRKRDASPSAPESAHQQWGGFRKALPDNLKDVARQSGSFGRARTAGDAETLLRPLPAVVYRLSKPRTVRLLRHSAPARFAGKRRFGGDNPRQDRPEPGILNLNRRTKDRIGER